MGGREFGRLEVGEAHGICCRRVAHLDSALRLLNGVRREAPGKHQGLTAAEETPPGVRISQPDLPNIAIRGAREGNCTCLASGRKMVKRFAASLTIRTSEGLLWPWGVEVCLFVDG